MNILFLLQYMNFIKNIQNKKMTVLAVFGFKSILNMSVSSQNLASACYFILFTFLEEIVTILKI